MRTIYTPSKIDKSKEEYLWQSATIVFDTCALLDFYFLTPEYQNIMSEILQHLQKRIWIPAHVYEEYYRNYSHAFTNPANEKYQDGLIQKDPFVKTLRDYISQWEQQYYHPYICDDKLQKIKQLLNEIDPKIAEIKTIVSKEYQARKQEIRNIQNDDKLKSVIDLFTRGNAFTFDEIKGIIQEGDVRYKNQIPPGYKDAETKEGLRQYGDLIIWKEILNKAKESKTDIIFISNDLKPDWIICDETGVNKKASKPSQEEIGNPRRELLAEFEETTNQSIWFYTPSVFITKLEELFQPSQTQLAFYGKLGVVRDVLERCEREHKFEQSYIGDAIFLRCNHCGELFAVDGIDLKFDWERETSIERNMGPENEYVSKEFTICPHCENSVELMLRVWEYPYGVFNGQSIEVEGAIVEKPFDLSNYIGFDDYEPCCKCGEHQVLNKIGLCERCQEEFDQFVNSNE